MAQLNETQVEKIGRTALSILAGSTCGLVGFTALCFFMPQVAPLAIAGAAIGGLTAAVAFGVLIYQAPERPGIANLSHAIRLQNGNEGG